LVCEEVVLHRNFRIFKGVIVVLLIAMVWNMMIILQMPYIHGEEGFGSSSGVEFVEINFDPSDIRQGDYITVNVTVINNSSAPITFRGGCESPIWLTFSSSNVEVINTPACQGFGIFKIEPGQSATIKGPPQGVLYKAISYGTIDAEVNFAYGIGEEEIPSKIISKTIMLKIDSGKEEQPHTQHPFTISSSLDGTSYTITGKSITARATSFTINPHQSVIVTFDGSGEVELTLTKSMIDGITDVTAGTQQVSYKQVNSTSSSTTIKFTIPEGASYLEIRGNTVVSEFPFENNNEKKVREILSPHKQVLSGINPQDVICSKGLELIFKSTDNSPACVKSSTAEKLIKRGWAKS